VLDTRGDWIDEAEYSGTDWLHRRTALPLRFRAVLGGAAIEIRTNSQLFGEAVSELQRREALQRQSRVFRWEIEVETKSENEACVPQVDGSNDCERFAFGLSRSIRMGDGSWFALTPSSMDGVGFVSVAGEEGSQVNKLRSFFGVVREFVLESVAERNCAETDEAVA
jgi:hypothetical protein